MKISVLYSSAVFIFYCKVLEDCVWADWCQENFHIVSAKDNLLLLDPCSDERFGYHFFKRKWSGNMSKNEFRNEKDKCLMTCSSITRDCLRECKKKNCKQKTRGDSSSCIHSDVLYTSDAFDQVYYNYLQSNYDRTRGYGSSNSTSESLNESCEKRNFGSTRHCIKGEGVHEQDPTEKLLSSLELSLMISIIATAASLCSMFFMFITLSFSNLKRDGHRYTNEYESKTDKAQGSSNRHKSQRQRRRNRQRKWASKQNCNKVFKQNENDVFKQNENEVFKQSENNVSNHCKHEVFNQREKEVFQQSEKKVSKKSENDVPKQSENEVSKQSENKVSKQSEILTAKQMKELLSTNREEARNASNTVICISESYQTETPAVVSENEVCTSATQVKQYKFSNEAIYLSQEEIIETENCAEGYNKTIEIERTCIASIPLLEHLFENDDLLDSETADQDVVPEVVSSLNLLTDFEQEQTLSYLKLPDPSIFSTEDTVPKGSQNIQNECTLFHHTQYTYTTGYPFDTDSTEQKCSTLNTFSVDGSPFEFEYTKDAQADMKHSNIIEYPFEKYANSTDEIKDCEIYEVKDFTENLDLEKFELQEDFTCKNGQLTQKISVLHSEHHSKCNEQNDKNEELPENVSTAKQIGRLNIVEELVSDVTNAEKAEILVKDDKDSCSCDGSYLQNHPDSDTESNEIPQSVDRVNTESDHVNKESYPIDSCYFSGEIYYDSGHQRNTATTNVLPTGIRVIEVVAYVETNDIGLQNKDDKKSDEITSDECLTLEEIEENNFVNKHYFLVNNNSLNTSCRVGETFPIASIEVINESVPEYYLSKRGRQSMLGKRKNNKRGKNLFENRLCNCQRTSSNCCDQEIEGRSFSYRQNVCTVQVGETGPITSADSCNYQQQSYSTNVSDDPVTLNSSIEECSSRHEKSASNTNLSKKGIRGMKCSERFKSTNRFKSESKLKRRKVRYKGLAKTGDESPNESSLDLPSAINSRKGNTKKRFCSVCHKSNIQCKMHKRNRFPFPEYGSLNRLCSQGFDSTKCRNDHTKKEEKKLGKTEAVALVCHDSGFISGSSTNFDSSRPKQFNVFCEGSPAKLFHERLLKDIRLAKLTFDFFEQLKVLQNSIDEVERQHITKSICRELHIEHRNLTIFGLNSYFDRLNNGPPPTTRERMQYEWIRLASFYNYTGNGNALALARNGFYHDHNEGPMSTRCYLCEARHSDWEMFDDISAEHRRRSPHCPFHDNREEESLNISITYGDSGETPAISSSSSIGRSVSSSVNSSSSNSTSAAAVRGISSSLRATYISQAHVGDSGGESIPQQPTEDPESRDRSLLALSQPRTQRALGRTGQSYSAIIAPRRNNVATGARSNVGFESSSTGSQLPGIRPSSILGGPVGAGAFSGLNTTGQNTSALTAVTRATEGSQQSSAPSPSTEAAAGTRQTNPAPGAGGRTDPTITVVVHNPKHPDYVNIDSRVGSYQGWPDYLDQTPRQMSEAGFFFVGVADFTRCFCCGGGLRNWEPGDDPMLEHTRWFPRCEYVNRLKGERYVAAVQRRHQEHIDEQQRQQLEIAQRRDENRNPPDPMTTEAAAVMREMGYSAERSREAIMAVRRQTGLSVVTTEQVLTWLLDDEERQLTGNSSNTEFGIRPPPTSTFIASSIMVTSTPSSSVYTGTSIGTTIVNTTLSISTASSIVSARATTSTVNSTSTSASATLSSVTAEEMSGNQQTGSGNISSSTSSSGTNVKKQSGASNGDSVESKSASIADETSSESANKATKKKNPTKKAKTKAGAKSETTGAAGGDSDAKSLKAENEKLREMQTCKICMERAVNTTLLPCGHLVCCDTCASRLQRCPICRKRIKGTVKTFMS